MSILDKIGTKPQWDEEGKLLTPEEAEKTEEKVEAKAKEEVEEKTEVKTEEKVAEKTEEKAEEDENKEEVSPFSFDSFKSYAKEKYERDIDSEDDLLGYFDKASKYDELSPTVSELKQKNSELEGIASKGINGRDWFVSDDEFVRQQFLKNSEEKFSEAALGVLSNLSPEKVKKLDPIEAIKAKMMVDNPELEKPEVEALVLDELGVDSLDQEEWEALSTAKMKKQANEAKKSLASLYKDIEIPKAVDFESSRTALKESWSTPVKEIVDGITSLELSEDLKFDITGEMKSGLYDEVIADVLQSQVKPSEDAAGDIAGKVRSKLLERNMDKIIKVLTDTISEKEKAKWQSKVHNEKDLNNDTRPEDTKEEGVLEGRDIFNIL